MENLKNENQVVNLTKEDFVSDQIVNGALVVATMPFLRPLKTCSLSWERKKRI